MIRFNNIVEVISYLRKQMGITEEELGNKAGLKKADVVKLENNQRALSLEEAEDISKVFLMDVDSLFKYISNVTNMEIEDISFVKVLKGKGMKEEDLEDVRRVELLIDALHTQKRIFK